MAGSETHRWMTGEEFEALIELFKNGKVSPIVALIRNNEEAVHPFLLECLEQLDHWDNDLPWLITATPRASRRKVDKSGKPIGEPGRPTKKQLRSFKMLILAELVIKAHIHFVKTEARTPSRKEIREFVCEDETRATAIGFLGKGRTTQDKMVAEALKIKVPMSLKLPV